MSELESNFIEKCFTYLEREAKRKLGELIWGRAEHLVMCYKGPTFVDRMAVLLPHN